MLQPPQLVVQVDFDIIEAPPELLTLLELLAPFFEGIEVIEVEVVGHEIEEKDVDGDLEGDDDCGEQKVKQEIFLPDSPFLRHCSFMVELPNQQIDERLLGG